MGNVQVLNQRLEVKSIEENYQDTNCLATRLRTVCINNTRCILQPAMFHHHAIWENEALNTSTVRPSHILHPGGLLRNQCSHVMKEWLILHPAQEGKMIRCNIHCVSGVTASKLFVLTVKFTAKMEQQTNASTDLVSDERELRQRSFGRGSPLYYFESQTWDIGTWDVKKEKENLFKNAVLFSCVGFFFSFSPSLGGKYYAVLSLKNLFSSLPSSHLKDLWR